MVSEAAVKAKEVYVIVRKLMKDNIKRQKLYDDRKLNWNHLIRVNNGNVTQVVLLSGYLCGHCEMFECYIQS